MARRGDGGVGSADVGGGDPPGAVRGMVSTLPAWFAILLGIAIGVGFFLSIGLLWGLADDDTSQQVWDRRQALYQTLTSLFGAVVGAVFGVGVISPRVGRAERRADAAEGDARRYAEDAANAKGDRRAAVERSRSDILRMAAEATRSNPEIVVGEKTFEAEDDARGALAMALAHPGPVNVVGAPGESGASPVISLADLAGVIEEAQIAEDAAERT